jgi:hypothetical protein
MSRVLIILATLAFTSPAFAGNHSNNHHGGNGFTPSQANQQNNLDKARAAPAPGGNQAVKDHIISVIKKYCPTCS